MWITGGKLHIPVGKLGDNAFLKVWCNYNSLPKTLGRAPARKPGRAFRCNLFAPPLATQKGFSLQSLTRIVVH